jgi:alpha-L-fucosidase
VKRIVFALMTLAAAAAPAADWREETPEQHAARMAWWREAKFGMFVHWGVYSVPAGRYHGQPVGGIGEWIMNSAKIPSAEYKGFAKQFNPVKYDPEAWVRLAKAAGMKYIVITSKHHDGFALFDSKATDWDVVDATPYGKDLLKPLAEACRREGLRLGFYYSQAQDWNHPGGAAAGGHWDPAAQDGDMMAYIRKIAVPQVKEILGHYGDISVLWWDTPIDISREMADELLAAVRPYPKLIINNRLGGGYPGDTETPEQQIPDTGFKDRDWETCMTMNDTWGFKSDDQNWKSVEQIVRMLADIASKGGNFLLNVGPTSEGLIPAPSVERLTKVGEWMKVNGDAIHGTGPSPFRRPAWGRCTTKALEGGRTRLFLHVFDWPADGRLVVPVENRPVAARLLAEPARKLAAAAADEGLVVTLSGAAPDAIDSVVAVDVEGAPKAKPYVISQKPDGSVVLDAAEAELHGPAIQVESKGGRSNVGFWTDQSAFPSWTFKVNQGGAFDVGLEFACDPGAAGTEIRIAAGDAAPATFSVPATASWDEFTKASAGRLELKPGPVTLTVKSAGGAKYAVMNLRAVTLTPAR